MDLLKQIYEAREAERRYMALRWEYTLHRDFGELAGGNRDKLMDECVSEASEASSHAIKLRDALPWGTRWLVRAKL